MRRTTSRLPDHLMEALEAKAEADHVSLAQVVRVALARYLRVPLDGDVRVFEFPASFDRQALSITVPAAWVFDLREILRGGNVIEAIRELRVRSSDTGHMLGLYEAKCVIDRLRAES